MSDPLSATSSASAVPSTRTGETTSTAATAAMNIHILGAGISGLVLARCLQRASPRAAVTLYERDAADVLSKRHGYAITLQPQIWRQMVPMLGGGEAVWKRIGVLGEKPEGEDGIRVNRRKLEEVMREGVEVRCGKEFSEVDVLGGRKVKLSFKGQDEAVDVEQGIVVGADGAHSPLRRALLPEVELAVLPYVAFNGKRRVDRKTWEERYRACFREGATVLQKNVASGATLLRISVDEIETERVSISYTYSRPARKERDSDALYKPNRPNAGAKDIPEELFEELRGIEPELKGAYKEVFNADAVRQDRLLHWLMRSLEVSRQDLVRLAESGVLFMGDAVHHAPIIGSEGANEAILDAMELAAFLTEQQDLTDWYSVSRCDVRWKRHVRDGVGRMDDSHRVEKAKV